MASKSLLVIDQCGKTLYKSSFYKQQANDLMRLRHELSLPIIPLSKRCNLDKFVSPKYQKFSKKIVPPQPKNSVPQFSFPKSSKINSENSKDRLPPSRGRKLSRIESAAIARARIAYMMMTESFNDTTVFRTPADFSEFQTRYRERGGGIIPDAKQPDAKTLEKLEQRIAARRKIVDGMANSVSRNIRRTVKFSHFDGNRVSGAGHMRRKSYVHGRNTSLRPDSVDNDINVSKELDAVFAVDLRTIPVSLKSEISAKQNIDSRGNSSNGQNLEHQQDNCKSASSARESERLMLPPLLVPPATVITGVENLPNTGISDRKIDSRVLAFLDVVHQTEQYLGRRKSADTLTIRNDAKKSTESNTFLARHSISSFEMQTSLEKDRETMFFKDSQLKDEKKSVPILPEVPIFNDSVSVKIAIKNAENRRPDSKSRHQSTTEKFCSSTHIALSKNPNHYNLAYSALSSSLHWEPLSISVAADHGSSILPMNVKSQFMQIAAVQNEMESLDQLAKDPPQGRYIWGKKDWSNETTLPPITSAAVTVPKYLKLWVTPEDDVEIFFS
ncbi:hypothetical protein HK100_007491 [Physocladia obscura]|uniref:Uncharacterized protein n=1 Tax=Physocladia obscura TaxID=109957 RepID=A0AAD5SQB7_9FUNG|nr:hypothetical protein HK100_007491 [Physocladia obscura]